MAVGVTLFSGRPSYMSLLLSTLYWPLIYCILLSKHPWAEFKLAAMNKIQGLFQDYFSHLQGHFYSVSSVWETFWCSCTKSRSDLCVCKNIFTMSSHFQTLSRTTTEIQVLENLALKFQDFQGCSRTILTLPWALS